MMRQAEEFKGLEKWLASDATALGKFLCYQLLFRTESTKICSGTERTILLAARNRYHHQDTHVIHCQYLLQASVTDISFELAYSIIVI